MYVGSKMANLSLRRELFEHRRRLRGRPSPRSSVGARAWPGKHVYFGGGGIRVRESQARKNGGLFPPKKEAPSFPTALCAASRREEGKWRDALFPLSRGSDRAEAKAAAREAGRKHPFCCALQNFLDFMARRSPPPKKRTSQIISTWSME